MSERYAPECLFSKQPLRDLADVFNELGLLTTALGGIAKRFHSEEYWDALGGVDWMTRAAIADGLQLEIMIKRLDVLLDIGDHFRRCTDESTPMHLHPPTAV